MSKKKDILRDLNKYSAKEIASFIREGVVSQVELQNNSDGQYTPFLKYMVEEALKNWVEETPLIEKEEKVINEKAADNPNVGKTATSSLYNNEMEKATDNPYVDKAEKTEKTFEEPPIEDAMVSQEDYDNLSSASEESHSRHNTTAEERSSINVDGGKSMFRRPFSFNGRIRRTEYGLTILIIYVIGFIFSYVMGNSSDYPGDGVIVAYLIYFLIGTWIQVAQSTKRCHDIGHSGWWQLIPFYGFWLLFDEGDGQMPNEYGESAK